MAADDEGVCMADVLIRELDSDELAVEAEEGDEVAVAAPAAEIVPGVTVGMDDEVPLPTALPEPVGETEALDEPEGVVVTVRVPVGSDEPVADGDGLALGVHVGIGAHCRVVESHCLPGTHWASRRRIVGSSIQEEEPFAANT